MILNCFHSLVLTHGEQGWLQGISLFSAFALSNLMNHPFLFFPQMCRGTAGRKGGVCRHLASSGLRSSLPGAKSNRTLQHHRWTTLLLWGFCLWQLALRVRCSMMTLLFLQSKRTWTTHTVGVFIVSTQRPQCPNTTVSLSSRVQDHFQQVSRFVKQEGVVENRQSVQRDFRN